MRAAGVLVDERDLAECQPQVQDPIGIAYRGFRVTQTPPNSTGFSLLQMLKMVERFDVAALDPVQRIHVLVEAKKRAFVDRERYGTDPRFGDLRLDRLLSDAYADECAAAIDRTRAADIALAEPDNGRRHDVFLRGRCARATRCQASRASIRCSARESLLATPASC